MKLLELQLLRFGPFTDVSLDFQSGGADFHLLFGANEAGKSTSLRAVSGLLFGIPETTRDHHLHAMTELRIGARLENRHGERLHVIRRKGRKDTLLDAAGNPLDAAVLGPFLGGLSRELFETLFGLSHEALVRGGQDLLEGRGELGASLFGAGLGVRGFHAVRASLQQAADALFTPTARQRPLNLAIRNFQEFKKQAAQLSLKPREWQQLQEALREAEGQLAERENAQAEALTELRRLQRLQRVLPRLRSRQALLDRRQDLGAVKILAESCPEERREAQHSLHNLAAQERKLLDERQRCEQERAALQVPEALLARETLLEELRDRLGAHRKALRDLPGLEASTATAREEARAILRELGRADTLEDVERLRISAAAQERIRRLAQQGTRLETELDRAGQDLAAHESALQVLQRQCDALPPVRDGGPLRRLIAEIQRRGDLEAQLRALEGEIAGLQELARNRLAALSLWRGPLESVAALPLPIDETVERFQGEFQALVHERTLLVKRRDDIHEQQEHAAARRAALEARGEVPSEAAWRAARQERDALWREIRSVWLEQAPPAGKIPETLADRYERTLARADTLADRLWRDAERAAQHASLSTELSRRSAELAGLDEALRALSQREAALLDGWRALWPGIDPLPPAEMRGWLGRHAKLVETVGQWGERERARTVLLEEIADYRDRLGRELAALDKALATTQESLAILLQRAEEVSDRLAAEEELRRQVLRDLDRVSAELQGRQKALERCERSASAWRAQWGEAVQPLGLDASAGLAEAEAIVSGLSRLFRKLDDACGYQLRIDQIGSDARQFAEQVAELARDCAPDLQDTAAEAAAAELINRLNRGREERQNRHNLDRRLKEIHKELRELAVERENAQATLTRLMAEAGVTSVEALEAAEQRSREYRESGAKLRDLEEQLLAEGVPLAELIAQAQGVDPDRLPAAIGRQEEARGELERDCRQYRERVWQLNHQLRAMDGSSQAAEAAAAAQGALAEIKTEVENYVRLKLSELLLNREIERYRERNQGPLIQRAGELFRRMTLDAFSGLGSGFGADDKLILLCLRGADRQVPVEGLSEGSRDQLYLALRLASLERHLEHGEPPPLVVDDILINFDDRRAKATLELLGELSAKTQVLFFTHHRRLLELAREAIPPGRLKEHELDKLN